MTIATRRRLFFWGYLAVVTALYLTACRAIDHALIVWSQTGGIR